MSKPSDETALVLKDRTLYELAMLMVDGENTIEPEVKAFYELELKHALENATPEKIEGVVYVLDQMALEASAVGAKISCTKEQLDRYKKSQDRLEKSMEHLKDSALAAMKLLDAKELKGKTSTLRALGTAPAIDRTPGAYYEPDIPMEYKDATVEFKCSARDLWKHSGQHPEQDPASEWELLVSKMKDCTVTYSVNAARLLKALREPCVECMGDGYLHTAIRHPDGSSEIVISNENKCLACLGKGTRYIPGARLLSDRKRLVIS